jgi:hypothetical protein
MLGQDVSYGSRLCENSLAHETRRTLFFRWAIPTARAAARGRNNFLCRRRRFEFSHSLG